MMKRIIVLGAVLMVSLALVGSATAASAPTTETVSSDVVFGHDHWLGWFDGPGGNFVSKGSTLFGHDHWLGWFDDGSGSLLAWRPPDVCDWHGCLTG